MTPGDVVLTPSGSIAELVVVHPERGEALVRWANGATLRLQLTLLRHANRRGRAS